MEKKSKAQRDKERRILYIKLHKCIRCGKPLPQEDLRQTCESCRLKKNKYDKEKYLLYKQNGICVKCDKRNVRNDGRIRCQFCCDKYKQCNNKKKGM